MKELRRTTLRLTIVYSIIFFGFLWLFSVGLYVWTNNSLGQGYVNRINETIEQSSARSHQSTELSDNASTVAADVALDNLRNILLIINAAALVVVPLLAYELSRRSLRPLVEGQLQQQQFITNASHELRTPLAIMAGELELAARQTRTIKEYQTTIKNTANAVAHMSTLVHELLLLARMTSHTKQNLTAERLDIAKLLQTAAQPFLTKAKRKQLKIKIIMPDTSKFSIHGNQELLVIALSNLIDNAVKFAHHGTTIFLEAKQIDHNSTIIIRDTGKRINNIQAKHLFERFYQTETDHSPEGFGLGLAIAKEIINLHHATINLESKGDNVAFYINFS